MTARKILVIKLGALGDFVQALGPMAAIRRHHAQDHITLLTAAPFSGFGRSCGYFDDVAVDTKPRWSDFSGWVRLRRFLNGGGFDRVYDLQNNDRTAFYLRLFSPRPEWVGAAPGASHRNTSPLRTAGQAFDGHVQTLALAGVRDIEIDRLDWAQGSPDIPVVPSPYLLLVPGAAPGRDEKRWPPESYAALARSLNVCGVLPVVIGGAGEADAARVIRQSCPAALDLTGRTTLEDIVVLARRAAGAVGNDTGPMHLIAPTGCPSVVLFSSHSNPIRHAPKGASVQTLRADKLADLAPEAVLSALQPVLRGDAEGKGQSLSVR